MAIRYSGDVEIRVLYKGGRYTATVRAPGFRARTSLTANEAKVRSAVRTSPEAYDQAARAILLGALGVARRQKIRLDVAMKGSSLDIRRTFQSPCPA